MRVTQSELARLAELSPQRIHQLIQSGVLTRGTDNLLDAAESLKALKRDQDPAKVQKELDAKGVSSPDPDGYRAARAMREKATAMRIGLAVEKERGRLIERDVALAACADIVVAARRQLLEIPDRLAGEMAHTTSAPPLPRADVPRDRGCPAQLSEAGHV